MMAAMDNAPALPDHDVCYAALRRRDPAYDGRVFTCVTTTGIFCRPVCPARPPKPENCRFVADAATAIALGFRPCKRCRPEAAPTSAVWRGTANTVTRALRLIDAGALDDGDAQTLAARLGIGERQLRRLFQRHLGSTPSAVARAFRLQRARRLLASADSITEVAHAAGFGSLRRLQSAMRASFGVSPSALRTQHKEPHA